MTDGMEFENRYLALRMAENDSGADKGSWGGSSQSQAGSRFILKVKPGYEDRMDAGGSPRHISMRRKDST